MVDAGVVMSESLQEFKIFAKSTFSKTLLSKKIGETGLFPFQDWVTTNNGIWMPKGVGLLLDIISYIGSLFSLLSAKPRTGYLLESPVKII